MEKLCIHKTENYVVQGLVKGEKGLLISRILPEPSSWDSDRGIRPQLKSEGISLISEFVPSSGTMNLTSHEVHCVEFLPTFA